MIITRYKIETENITGFINYTIWTRSNRKNYNYLVKYKRNKRFW